MNFPQLRRANAAQTRGSVSRLERLIIKLIVFFSFARLNRPCTVFVFIAVRLNCGPWASRAHFPWGEANRCVVRLFRKKFRLYYVSGESIALSDFSLEQLSLLSPVQLLRGFAGFSERGTGCIRDATAPQP